jgi:hypothetical protein
MTLRPATVLHLLDLVVLRCASLLVPARERAEWWREWRAELWHVRQACTPLHGILWTAEQEVTMFCLGAFQDALCLRGQLGRKPIPHATTMGSAAQCILLLLGLVATSYGVALLLPGVSLARQSAHYRDARNLMLIRDARYSDISVPSISAEQYQAWKRRRQDVFDGFAFYQLVQQPESGLSGMQATGRIAVASPNLFQLLGLPIRFATSVQDHNDLPRLILSDETWKRKFDGDPNISGRTVQLGTRSAVVGGVAPPGFWRLPGKVDGWLLAPDAGTAGQTGFVVAHLKSSSEHANWGENWDLAAPTPDGTMGDFACSSLTERTLGPNDLFLFAVFLACLALPATTSLPLGEYRVTSQKLSWSTRLRRWGFLGCKIALLLPIVYLVSLDLAHLRSTVDLLSAEYIQLASSFSICLFGLRWMLRDQRQRCPVCLKRLTHPARVGQPSRNFLAWNGTELICVAGHGLLHIPEIQTSWFGTQRWLYLDPSWDVLFADPGLASVSYF